MTTHSRTLEVIALTPADARAAAAGGADRLELVGTMADDGLSPDPALVARVVAASALPVRVMLRLRGGFETDDAESARLADLAHAYRDAGAAGLVLGFLTARGDVDLAAVRAIAAGAGLPWTFHRAIDHAASADEAWAALLGAPERARSQGGAGGTGPGAGGLGGGAGGGVAIGTGLPGLDQVLTAGSARGVTDGLAALTARAAHDPAARERILAGGGLRLEHVVPLAAAGVGSFHIGSAARPGGSFAAPVDPDLVRLWRSAVHAAPPAGYGRPHDG